jgi:hypothetical protein
MTKAEDIKAIQSETPKAPAVSQKDELTTEQLDGISGGGDGGTAATKLPPPPRP